MSARQFFRIPDVSGGLNPDQNPVLIADNEAAYIQNIRLDKVGSLISRRGYARYTGFVTPTSLLAIGRWNPPDAPASSKVVGTTVDGHFRFLDPNATASSDHVSLLSGLSTSAVGEFTAVRNQLMYANGVNLPVLYNGTTAVLAGIAAPATPGGSDTGAGSLAAGTYKYAYTLYDNGRGTESNPSDTISVVAGASRAITLTGLPASHARATHLRIYRTDVNAEVLMRLVQVAIVGGTTTYVDDGSLTPNFLLPLLYDRSVPLALKHVAYVKGFVFGSVDNRLYWSRAYEPEAWPALNFTEVPFEGNDTIIGLRAFQDTLVVFGRRNIVLVAGSSGNFQLSRLDIDTGLVNARATVEVDGSLLYLSHAGLRVVPGNGRFAPKLDRLLAALPRATIELASLIYVPEERAIWMAVDGGIYTIHVPNQAISWYVLKTHYMLDGGSDGFGYPLYVDSGLLHVNRYGAVADLGTAIPIVWRSKVFQLTNPETQKFFRRIGSFASIGSAGVVTVTISDQNVSYSVPLTSLGDLVPAKWDEELWDSFKWSAEGQAYFIGALPAQNLRGHTIQITITADALKETEIVTPITFEYREANRFLGQ